MGIGAINSYGIGPYKVQYPEFKPEKENSSLTNVNITTVIETASVNAAETAVEADESEASDSGVIRNLLDGHFRGVADVRLRINFADEIAALEAEKAAELTQAGVSEINGIVTSEIESFLQTEGLDEGIAAIISDGLQNFNSIDTATASAVGGSIAQLQSTFDAYIESIRTGLAGLAQPIPEETIDTSENPVLEETTTEETTIPPATEESTTAPDWQLAAEQFITELSLSFETALNELNTELENLTVLPELSQPNGNGRAYDKFLSIYNEIQQSGANASESNLIDATA
jgi:hypothetical protein